jgi:hypothetical protein
MMYFGLLLVCFLQFFCSKTNIFSHNLLPFFMSICIKPEPVVVVHHIRQVICPTAPKSTSPTNAQFLLLTSQFPVNLLLRNRLHVIVNCFRDQCGGPRVKIMHRVLMFLSLS